jgi:acetyl-CoA synthetase
MKLGSACLPCLGIKPAIVDPLTGAELKGNHVEGALAIEEPWPSLARTIRGDHSRYMDAYFNNYKGCYVSLTFVL